MTIRVNHPKMPHDSLLVFSYLNADRFLIYRAIMATFMEERERFALHLRAKELNQLIEAKRPGLVDEATLVLALGQLCVWGNLERHQDVSEVRTVEEFYQPRYLYQLTRAGEEAERAIHRYLAAVIEGGELQTAALGDIRRQLGALALIAQASPIDEGKAFDAFTQLRSTFEELTTRAQTFMSSLQRSIELQGAEPEGGLLEYKDILITYLQKFILELRNSTGEVSARALEIESQGLDTLLLAVARRELVDALDQSEDNLRLAAHQWRLRWQGLRSWFLKDSHMPSHAEVLRKKALSAIPQLLRAIHRINERRISRTDRVADLRVLARWFAEADTDAGAHRLWMAAFGLAPSRHMTVDSDSLTDRETKPVRPQTSWLAAASVKITPRLRSTGRYARKGPGTAIIDRTKEKDYLAHLEQEEAAQIGAARLHLVAQGSTRLSQLGPLSEPGFELFLDLLGDALANDVKEGEDAVETTSSDGTLLIRLEPTRDGKTATIATSAGAFSGPDHFLRVLA